MRLLRVFFFSLVISIAAYPAFSQEIIGVQEQIDAIKEELIILQRKIYRDNLEAPVPTASSSNAAVQLTQYDEIIRTMNGKIDEMEFKIKQLENKIDTMNRDFDIRFKLLEGKPIPAASGSVEAPRKFDTAVASGAPKSIIGDTISTGELKSLETDKKKSSVKEIYDTGLKALQNGDRETAKKNFNTILTDYSSDKLAGNAQYWLGETYYSEKDYTQAAIAFNKGYKNYKNGTKGADSFLKLGLSMEQLGKKVEACAAFTNLSVEFPNAEETIKNKAKAEAKKLGCK